MGNAEVWGNQVVQVVSSACCGGHVEGGDWDLVLLRNGTYSLQCPRCGGLIQGFTILKAPPIE